MIRFGAPADAMAPFDEDKLFMENIKLLVIMAKATLKAYPMGKHRRNAVQAVCRNLFYQSLYRTAETQSPEREAPQDSCPTDRMQAEHFFLQRTQLLAVMMTAMGQSSPRGEFRNQALVENVDRICDHLSDHVNLQQITFLKVA